MSVSALDHLTESHSPDGGMPARRAVMRWAWRLFRREWRQQLLILVLVLVAVAATIIGAAVSANSPPPADSGFGTAQDLAIYHESGAHVDAEIAQLRREYGDVDVIENQTVGIPGSVKTYQLRAQNPHGPFGQSMLSLVSGRYPSGSHQVAVTGQLASDMNLRVGATFRTGGVARRVVGIVENPQNLLDEFALVIPGQVPAPTEVNVLFDAPGVPPSSIGRNVSTPQSVSSSGINPETISIAGMTVGMLLIALVAIGGFTVLAQRRLRSLGMLSSLGATDKNVGLVVRANGAVVGVVGAVIGVIIGLAAWLAYRPSLEQSAHHVIGPFALPWSVIILAVVFAVAATYLAASFPARAITRVPIMAALSGQPVPPKQVHRPAALGVVLLVISFFLFGLAGSTGHGGGTPELVIGFLALIPGVILLAPLCLAALARGGGAAPIAVRLALRDLSRYRSRSGSALAAISVGVMIAAVIVLFAASRYGDVLDYAGPNLASNQLIVYTANGSQPFPGPSGPGTGVVVTASKLASDAVTAHQIGAALGAKVTVELEITSATLWHATGRNFTGPVYVATSQLLAAYGIRPSQIDPDADILTMRPGLSGTPKVTLVYGRFFNAQGLVAAPQMACPKSSCLANPVIEEVDALPSGTSAPNTVITQHAVRQLGLRSIASGWLIQTEHVVSAGQIREAQFQAASAGMTVETKNSEPTSSEIINLATVFGIALAFGILAMSAGLLRSETAGDLRTLAAMGASSRTRRTITAVTVITLGFLGALLGVFAGYLGVVGFLRTNSLNSLSSLANVPVRNLLIILFGMPVVAAAVGWLFAGREPSAIDRPPNQ